MELLDLQNEICPRISTRDFVRLLIDQHEQVAAIDLRSSLEFKRCHIRSSINIPFSSVLLGDVRLDALNVPDLNKLLMKRIVVVYCCHRENSILV